MKRLGLILALAVLLVPVAATASTAPRLRIAVDSPLDLRGSGFKPLERVKITAAGVDEPLVRWVVATRVGTFRVRFAASADWCNGIRDIRAAGRKGSKAEALVKRLGECAAP
jgi:hypothetical protein